MSWSGQRQRKRPLCGSTQGIRSLYGAIREQMDRLEEMGIAYDVCPGVSSFNGAAASLGAELTPSGRCPRR